MSGAPFSAAAGRPPPDDRTLREFPSNSGVLPSARRHRPAPAAPTYATSPHRSKLPASAWATAHAEPYSSSRSRAIRVARSRCSAVPVGHDLHPSQKGSGIKPGTVQGPLRRARGQSFISRQSPTCLGCFHPSCGRTVRERACSCGGMVRERACSIDRLAPWRCSGSSRVVHDLFLPHGGAGGAGLVCVHGYSCAPRVGLGPPIPRMRGHRIMRRVVTAAARVRGRPVAPRREALDLAHGFTPNRTRECCPCGGDRAAAYGSRCGPAGRSGRPKHHMVPAARVRRQDTSVAPGIRRTAPSRSRRRPAPRRTTDRDRGPDTAGPVSRAERSGQRTPRPVIGPGWVAARQVRAGRRGECTADEPSNRQLG
jgi:hypothetical protein